jgi:hypothetical protein
MKVADDAVPAAVVVGTTVKRLLCCGFDALLKQRDRSISVGGGYDEK